MLTTKAVAAVKGKFTVYSPDGTGPAVFKIPTMSLECRLVAFSVTATIPFCKYVRSPEELLLMTTPVPTGVV